MPPSSVNSGKRRANQPERVTEQPPVERQRLQRTPGQCSTIEFRAIVRMPRIGPQLDLGLTLEDLDRFGTGFQKPRTQRGIGTVTDDLLQISLDIFGAVGDRPTAWRVFGIQIEPAENAEVPPTNAVFSTSSVLAPRMAANSAADIPAAPAPMTTTS